MNDQLCENCRFFLCSDDAAGDGWCRRHPPSIINRVLFGGKLIEPDGYSTFPITYAEDWCGEYQPNSASGGQGAG